MGCFRYRSGFRASLIGAALLILAGTSAACARGTAVAPSQAPRSSAEPTPAYIIELNRAQNAVDYFERLDGLVGLRTKATGLSGKPAATDIAAYLNGPAPSVGLRNPNSLATAAQSHEALKHGLTAITGLEAPPELDDFQKRLAASLATLSEVWNDLVTASAEGEAAFGQQVDRYAETYFVCRELLKEKEDLHALWLQIWRDAW